MEEWRAVFCVYLNQIKPQTTMKKLVLMLAFAGMAGSISAMSLTKGDDKDKDKAKKECCKKGEGKACCKKGEGKACSGDKKAEGTKETKPEEKK